MDEQQEIIERLIAENKHLKKELEKIKRELKPERTEFLLNEDESFHRLFDEMNSASALHRMVFDEQGNPVDYVFIRVNKMFESFTGLKAEEVVGRSVLQVIPDIEQSWIERYGRVVLTGEPVEFENYVQPLDRYYSVRAYRPVENQFVVTFFDITEKKKSESKIFETKLFYEQILETTHDGIWVTNQDDVVVFANSSLVKIAGVGKSDMIGGNVFKDFPEYTFNELSAYYMKARELKKPIEYEVTVLTLSKRRSIQTGWLLPIIENDQFKGIICTIQDITEKREAEKALIEHELKLQEIVGNLNGIVYRCRNDEDWTMIFLSAGVSALTGYAPKDILENKVISYNEIIYPEDREMVGKKILDAVLRDDTYRLEYRIATSDGNCKWVFEQGAGVKSETGELIYLEGYIFDISDRKKMELEIMEKNREIAAQNEEYLSVNEELQSTIEQIQSINVELREAKLKAEESDRLKSAFLANMSHEIRTPMNSIIGFSGLMTEKGLKWDKRKRYSHLVLSAGEHLLRIIDDIVDIAKIESNQLRIDRSEQNLVSLLNETYLYHLQSKLLKQKSELELRYNTDNLSSNLLFDTDPVRFKQVINNLLSNAIKNTFSGFVEFGVKQINLDEKQIVFYVKDTGVGIPEDSRSIIFERFMQLRGEELVAGTGLGLSICKGILNLMGGAVWLDSEVGKGTTFYFSLPYEQRTRDEQPIVEQKKSFLIPKLKNKLVYIAEDDSSSFLYLKEILEITNARIAHAANGLKLIEMVQQEVPDLVLADISMPQMNGYDAVKEIRRLEYTFPIIAQTAYALVEERNSCMEAGCSAYISKPIDANLLFELINKNMDQ